MRVLVVKPPCDDATAGTGLAASVRRNDPVNVVLAILEDLALGQSRE
jgi:hypothetical protein